MIKYKSGLSFPFDIDDGELYITYYFSPYTNKYVYIEYTEPFVTLDNRTQYRIFNTPETVTLFFDLESANQQLKKVPKEVNALAIKLKDLCKVCYVIHQTFKKDQFNYIYPQLKIFKKWGTNIIENTTWDGDFYYYYENQYDTFLAKLNECKINCTNLLQEKIINIMKINPENL